MFLLDYLLAHGTGYFLIVSIFLVQGFHAVQLGWAVPRYAGFTAMERTIAGSAAWVFYSGSYGKPVPSWPGRFWELKWKM